MTDPGDPKAVEQFVAELTDALADLIVVADVRRYLHPDLLAAARDAVQRGAGHDCDEWINHRGQCALCDRWMRRIR